MCSSCGRHGAALGQWGRADLFYQQYGREANRGNLLAYILELVVGVLRFICATPPHSTCSTTTHGIAQAADPLGCSPKWLSRWWKQQVVHGWTDCSSTVDEWMTVKTGRLICFDFRWCPYNMLHCGSSRRILIKWLWGIYWCSGLAEAVSSRGHPLVSSWFSASMSGY